MPFLFSTGTVYEYDGLRILRSEPGCGVPNDKNSKEVGERIVVGEDAQENQFPWICSIQPSPGHIRSQTF
jgi:hypothetical protein